MCDGPAIGSEIDPPRFLLLPLPASRRFSSSAARAKKGKEGGRRKRAESSKGRESASERGRGGAKWVTLGRRRERFNKLCSLLPPCTYVGDGEHTLPFPSPLFSRLLLFFFVRRNYVLEKKQRSRNEGKRSVFLSVGVCTRSELLFEECCRHDSRKTVTNAKRWCCTTFCSVEVAVMNTRFVGEE